MKKEGEREEEGGGVAGEGEKVGVVGGGEVEEGDALTIYHSNLHQEGC